MIQVTTTNKATIRRPIDRCTSSTGGHRFLYILCILHSKAVSLPLPLSLSRLNLIPSLRELNPDGVAFSLSGERGIINSSSSSSKIARREINLQDTNPPLIITPKAKSQRFVIKRNHQFFP